MITIFVPAKIHLLGEHAVVYGKPALLAAINKRISVQIVPSKIKSIQGAGIHLKEIRELLKILEKEIRGEVKPKKNKAAAHAYDHKDEESECPPVFLALRSCRLYTGCSRFTIADSLIRAPNSPAVESTFISATCRDSDNSLTDK